MPTVKELQDKINPIAGEIRKMADTLTGDKKDFTAEERSKWDSLNKDYDDYKRQVEVARRAEEIEGEQRKGHPNPPGLEDTPPRRGKAKAEREAATEDHRALAFQGWARRQYGLPLTKDQRAACERTGLNPSSRNLDIDLPRRVARTEAEQRALTTGTGSSGGFTVPQGFVRNLEKAMLDFAGPRQVADILRTDDGGELPWPTANDTGNVGALLAESTTIGSSVDPSFGRALFSAYKFSSKLVLVPTELLEDSAFNLNDELSAMLGERIGRAQEPYFTTGTGTSQPQGIVTGATLGVTAADVDEISPDEIIDLIHSVDPAYRKDPSFGLMGHDRVWAYIRKLKDGQGRYLYESNRDGGPDRVHGCRIVVNQSMASTIAAEAVTLLAGAFRKFKIRDVRKIRVRRLEERYADTDQVGFVAFLRSDSRVLDAGTHPIKKLVQAEE